MNYLSAINWQQRLLAWLHGPDGAAYAREMENEGEGQATRAAFGQPLHYGTPYFIGRLVGALVVKGAVMLPDMALMATDLPTAVGFCLLETPITLSGFEENGQPASTQLFAVGWVSTVSSREDADQLEWVTEREETTPDDWVRIEFSCWVCDEEGVWPGGKFYWHVGESLSELRAEAMKYAGPYVPCIEVVASLLLFMRQEVIVREPHRLPRQARRRLSPHQEHQQQVDVLVLRRAIHDHAEQATEAKQIDWTCQWIVGGHWRQQWYPKVGRHQPKWIMPYVKGPDDKPFKAPAQRVFAVVR